MTNLFLSLLLIGLCLWQLRPCEERPNGPEGPWRFAFHAIGVTNCGDVINFLLRLFA
ncbi:hypothetical protein D3C80_802950 [compost metagenome]